MWKKNIYELRACLVGWNFFFKENIFQETMGSEVFLSLVHWKLFFKGSAIPHFYGKQNLR